MTTAMSTPGAAARVPAWKRLGLKLKYAKDTPSNSENIQPSVGPPPKTAPLESVSVEKLNKPQKRPFEDPKPATPVKRTKPSEGPAIHSKPSGGKRSAFDDYQRSRAQAPQRHIGSLGPSGTLQAAGVAPKKVVFDDDDDDSVPLPPPNYTAEIANPVQEVDRPPSRRKSVSFTPDTKGQDGFSAQNFFKAWASGEDPSEKTATVGEKPKKEKKLKVKKSKSTLITKDDSASKARTAAKESADAVDDKEASAQALPYVDYLQQYHQDRGNWKFSKKHQNNLLKNLFNIYRIPPEHNPAIEQYISTLRGSARLRVAEQALQVLRAIWEKHQDELEMSIDTPAGRRVAYYQALHRHIERYAQSGSGRLQYIDDQLEELRRETEQGKRAEQTLARLEAELDEALNKELASEAVATPANTESSTSESVTAEPPTIPEGEVSTEPSPPRSEKKSKRNKRKARTQATEEEESSSESDGETESE